MKDLRDYILENVEINESAASKVFTFDFTDLENGEETLKSFEGHEGCEIEGQKLSIKVTEKNVDKMDSVQDILQQYAETIRKSSKNASSEVYANKTSNFSKHVTDFINSLDEIKSVDKNEQDKQDDVKDDDKDDVKDNK